VKCSQSECHNPALYRITWGEHPGQRGCFCHACTMALWQRAKGLIEAGLLYWIQEEIRKEML